MCSTPFGRFICHYMTNVKLDWNGNAIVTTSILSEIPIQRLRSKNRLHYPSPPKASTVTTGVYLTSKNIMSSNLEKVSTPFPP